MALFNRKKKDTKTKAVPPEVKQYYASEHRERVGLAWLIAFLSLIVTVVLIAGLFFGGRWIYRKVSKKTDTASTSQTTNGEPTQTSKPTSESKPNDLQPTSNPPADGGEITTPDSGSSSSSNSGSSSSTSSGSSSSSNSSSGSSSSTSSGSSSQSNSSDITNTGPGSTISIFVAVTFLATITHWQFQRRRLASSN